jgi:hypothetical protein
LYRVASRSRLDADPGPVGVELLGEHGGETRVAALAHLEVLGHDRHGVVGSDTDEGVGGQGIGGSALGRKAELDDEGRSGCGAGPEERAAGEGGHRGLPISRAASWMAARIRT